jgi:hypothetical protein
VEAAEAAVSLFKAIDSGALLAADMLYYALLAADMLYYNRGNCLIIQNH